MAHDGVHGTDPVNASLMRAALRLVPMPVGVVLVRDAHEVRGATVSSLIGYGAAVLCVEAPLFAFLTNKIDRRYLLTGSLALYAVGHLISAYATDFATLLIVRLIMVAGAELVSPESSGMSCQLLDRPVVLKNTRWPGALSEGPAPATPKS